MQTLNIDERSDKHITGWRVSAGDEHTVFDGMSGRLVSVPCGGLSGRTFKEAADCARLIAAAPELLAEMIKLRRRFHNACRGMGSDEEYVAGSTPGADAAISKALGHE